MPACETPKATYKISTAPAEPGSKCICGHAVAAHGSQGMICAGCRCMKFEAAK